MFYDLVAISYFIIPFVFYLLLISDSLFNTKIYRWISYVFFIISIGILVFSGIGEWFFWEEFSVRYNFIAVDYLVYTHEVVSNIRESYPMPIIVLGMLLFSAGIFALVKKHFDKTINSKSHFTLRLATSLILWLFPLLTFYSINKSSAEIRENGYFDNMNYSFGNSGHSIVDRKAFADDEISFENAWGVCNEDLFAKANQLADSASKVGKPFRNFL